MSKLVFVCCAIKNNNLLSKIIYSESFEEASSFFQNEEGIPPLDILGPFVKKKLPTKTVESFIFSNINKEAIYNGWLVKAFFLEDPKDHAFLLFSKRIDGKNIPSPGKIIVHISNLELI